MKVTKKDEKLARSLLLNDLHSHDLPKHLLSDRVNETWPSMLPMARRLNLIIDVIPDCHLHGETTEEEIIKWS